MIEYLQLTAQFLIHYVLDITLILYYVNRLNRIFYLMLIFSQYAVYKHLTIDIGRFVDGHSEFFVKKEANE